jgi:putative sterol carrier protein
MIETRLNAALATLAGLGEIVRFDLGDDGTYTVDARAPQPLLLTDSEEEPACTIRISKENLNKLIEGRLDPMLAYTFGKIKVSGSLGVAMKLVNALG